MWRNFSNHYTHEFRAYSAGELKNRIDNDVENISEFPVKQMIQFYYQALFLITVCAIMLILNWKLALIGFISIPLSFWMTRWLGKSVSQTAENYRNIYGRYEEWLKETLREWKEIKSFQLERKREIMFTRYWKKLSRLFFKKQLFWTMNRTFISIKDFFVTKLNLYFIGGLFIMQGQMSIGSLILFMSYYDQAFRSLNVINELDIQLLEQKPSIQRVLETVRHREAQPKPEIDPEHFAGPVHFENVSFAYAADGEKALDRLNFKVHPQECVTIVGQSGSGKSTIAKLMVGLLTPHGGNVWLNHIHRVHEINEEQMNRNIAIVMQDSLLFNLSVRENLLLANPQATREQIEQACRAAQIHARIEQLPDKYETILGENGGGLSGGERQRLAVARAILQNPKILILDESTSQMDHETEKLVLTGIREHLKKTTIIIVTHRLQSVLLSDRTIFIDKGRLVAEGKHSDLLMANPTYRNLFFQRKTG